MNKDLCMILCVLWLSPLCSVGQPYNVGEQTVVYTDSSRNRLIKTELWYPTSEADPQATRKTDLPFVLGFTIRNASFINQPIPLILLSHGTGGNRFGLAWLAIALARQGFMVAAPDHWGNTFDNKIPEYFVRYWERPLDISFLITTLLADKSFLAHIDKSKIGVAGFSFGGYTALALAGADLNCSLLKASANTPEGKKEFNIRELEDLRKLIKNISCQGIQKSFRDKRIKAVAALSPALGLGFDKPEQTQSVSVPVVIIGAGNDEVAPLKSNAKRYHSLIPGSVFTKLEGKAGHYVFLNVADENLKKEAKKYYTDKSTVNRAAVHKTVEEAVIIFFRYSLN